MHSARSGSCDGWTTCGGGEQPCVDEEMVLTGVEADSWPVVAGGIQASSH
ncbi:MAG: hypothetical protein JSV33_15300 [bacterium]|nr:MAG: hypothetical protein JSV33_15300 [bacterium]